MLAASIALAGAGAAQDVTPEPVPDEPIVVESDAPPGSSGQIASGAVAGLVIGLFVVALVIGSGTSD